MYYAWSIFELKFLFIINLFLINLFLINKEMEYELKNQMEILNFRIQQIIKKQDHQNQIIDFYFNTLNEEINKSTQQITQTEVDNLLCKIDNQKIQLLKLYYTIYNI